MCRYQARELTQATSTAGVPQWRMCRGPPSAEMSGASRNEQRHDDSTLDQKRPAEKQNVITIL